MVATLALGKGTDAAIFDPDTRLAFSSNADGTLTVVREDATGQFAVAETVVTQAGARTVALDPKMHNLFLVTAAPRRDSGGVTNRGRSSSWLWANRNILDS